MGRGAADELVVDVPGSPRSLPQARRSSRSSSRVATRTRCSFSSVACAAARVQGDVPRASARALDGRSAVRVTSAHSCSPRCASSCDQRWQRARVRHLRRAKTCCHSSRAVVCVRAAGPRGGARVEGRASSGCGRPAGRRTAAPLRARSASAQHALPASSQRTRGQLPAAALPSSSIGECAARADGQLAVLRGRLPAAAVPKRLGEAPSCVRARSSPPKERRPPHRRSAPALRPELEPPTLVAGSAAARTTAERDWLAQRRCRAQKRCIDERPDLRRHAAMALRVCSLCPLRPT